MIHCYCHKKIFEEKHLLALKEDFNDVFPGYKKKQCLDWFLNYTSLMFFSKFKLILVFVVNFTTYIAMEAVGPISRKKTMNEHTKSMLWMITVFYFLNLALVPPLLQFDLNVPILNFFGLL